MAIRCLGRAIRLLLLIYVATLVVIVAVDYAWPETAPAVRADAIICLGEGVSDDGLTRSSRERAVTCADLYAAGAAPQIAFTGIVAAPLMAEVALTRGVPQDAVIVEENSRSTLQNALFTAQFVPRADEVIIVTDAYHLPRSWVAFRVMGYEDISLATTAMPRLQARSLLREALAVWFNAGRVILWWSTPWLPEDARTNLLI